MQGFSMISSTILASFGVMNIGTGLFLLPLLDFFKCVGSLWLSEIWIFVRVVVSGCGFVVCGVALIDIEEVVVVGIRVCCLSGEHI